jgi:3-deoxy-7-phosphoheptulonate synthase
MSTNLRASPANLLAPIALKTQMPLRTDLAEAIVSYRRTITNILNGKDPRLLVIIGPCSVHDPIAVKDYARKLTALQQKCPNIFFVMRTYFEKPRTRKGWSGYLHDPDLDGTNNMQAGTQLTRKLLLELAALGVPCATETLSLIAPQYFDDLISFACIGARTTESQPHRELASGLSVPVGFKNSTSGSVVAAINAIHSAAEPKSFMGITQDGKAAVIHTTGNKNCCLVLRGGTEPNYERATVQKYVEQLDSEGMTNAILVDASHGNSGKDWQQQMQVIDYLTKARHPSIRGLMIESFIRDGSQSVLKKPLEYGISVTDSCIGFDKTQTLMLSLNHQCKE